MNNSLDILFFFGLLTFFQLWGGAAIGAGLRTRHTLPVVWGALIGLGPCYFGLERVIRLGSWTGLGWQVAWLAGSALAVALGLPRLRAWFLREGVTSLMIGTCVMAGGAVLGAVFFSRGSEALSLLVGGAGFLFGAMWFGSGLQRLRGK
ncbi:MAG: hypothetical protein CVU38_07085 [Chloroflexi bacterium HGW-Chloroflexi-1]|nr:MAG: hypothetical protein CVU38_07085 [Chloroflexi bacterium HGW-Chloroflexi-1]